MNAEQVNELYRLLNQLREGVITDADFERLDSWISNDEWACHLYVDYVKLWADLQGFQVATIPDYSSVSTDTWSAEEISFADSRFWRILAEHEEAAEEIELPEELPQHELIQKVIYPSREKQKISKFQIFTLITSAAAILVILLYVNYYPVHKEVATLTQSAHARWADIDRPMEIGTRLYEQESLFLKQGVAKIVFDSDAEVVLEAPVLIKLQNNGKVGLDLGRVYAYVPQQAIGFTVNTPHASFIDLGTEFGVDVDNSDKIQTRVYQGKVAVQVGSDSNVQEAVIGAGQVGLVDMNRVLSITEFSMQQTEFIRSVEQYQSGQSLLNRNLIVNGDFEKDVVTRDPQRSESQNLSENNVMISGWNDRGPATLNTYIALGQVPVPPDKGENFFIGYQACSIDQEISLADLSYIINRGKISYELSGWIGGWEAHEDHLEITASFLDNSDKFIGSAKIGPVTAEERNFQSCFMERSVKGILPPGVRKIVISLRSIHGSGDTTDAYADNLRFVLSSND
jgi:hypothetical protein